VNDPECDDDAGADGTTEDDESPGPLRRLVDAVTEVGVTVLDGLLDAL
jgi:hypothetical protein